MIYVTVGSVYPFSRLIREIDAIAPQLQEEVFAQIGRDKYIPRNISFVDFCKPAEHHKHIREATLVVAHASDGIMLEITNTGKRAVFVPRRPEFAEVANDNQIQLANGLESKGIAVKFVYAMDELRSVLTGGLDSIPVPNLTVHPRLIERLREVIVELSNH